jgi:hypothetical protein
MDLTEIERKMWTGCIWLRIGTTGGLLWTWSWTFSSHKRREISWLTQWLSLPQERFCFKKL